MDFTIGRTIGDYEVLAVLGAGGMGKVYKVRSTISQRIEAMKILLPDLDAAPDLADRFLREIRISAGLEHPNIAALRAAQRVENQLLMVMEFVDGSTLSELMRNGHIPLNDSLKYISQALSALDYAHSHGVVHRDIKPANIMITAGGEVKLMDFGIAKLATDASMTRTGMMVGSVPYMSPEQIEGREVDGRTDIYSLGITLYEMVTGKRPFDGKSDFEIMTAHLTSVPPTPRELDPSLPKPVNEIILTAMAKNAADRFATAKAMRNAVSSISLTEAKPAVVASPLSVPAPPVPSGAPVPAEEPKRAVEAPPVVAGVAPAKNHRTAYILVGSLATVAALIGLMLILPRFLSTHGGSEKMPAAQPVVTTPAKPPAAEIAAPVRDSSARVQEKKPEEPKLRAETVQRPARSDEQLARRPVRPAQIPDAIAAPAVAASPSPTPAVTHNPEPPAASQNNGEIEAMRDRMDLMSARVSSVRGSLNSLKEAQARSGLGLRGDMVETEQRLTRQMRLAEEKISANDAPGALKALDRAENDLEKLEGFLGH